MREARIRVAAEWREPDLREAKGLAESGQLSLDGLITHRHPAHEAEAAYRTAFGDPSCLKMILDWRPERMTIPTGQTNPVLAQRDLGEGQSGSGRPPGGAAGRCRPPCPGGRPRSSRSTARAGSARASPWPTSLT